jgi:hypothetical protein
MILFVLGGTFTAGQAAQRAPPKTGNKLQFQVLDSRFHLDLDLGFGLEVLHRGAVCMM